MTLPVIITYILIWLALIPAIIFAIRDAWKYKNNFDLEYSNMLREIMAEAKKKNLSGEPMILSALKRVLENIKSL